VQGIAQPCAYAERYAARGVVAIALAVLDGDWLGLYCAATLPHARRQGHSSLISSHLAKWGLLRGASRAHVGVLEENTPSQAMCQSLGFHTSHTYTYFTRL
jgi:N-acetylglutamate synthase